MLPWLAVAVTVALLGLLLWRVAVRLRRRGAGQVMAPFEEIWRPAAFAAHAEVREQAQRRAPAPSPDNA